jgi:hypothetical protein
MLNLSIDDECQLSRSLSALRGVSALLIPNGRTLEDESVLAHRSDLSALLELIERDLRKALHNKV